MTRLSIVSGGQTGVDRAALDVAMAKKIPYSGWCPRGGIAEDLEELGPVLLTKYGLRETPSDLAEQRTAWNVRDSNATLLIGHVELSRGTFFTKLCAELIFLRPFHVVNLEARDALYLTSHWLTSLIEGLRADQFRLNVAGPRESESDGIYEAAFTFIDRLLDPFCSETRTK
ncbi:MAG TPA: putative molybdenum carrier protein [Terriglobales bacterium]|nr:putative molybdenum carrier protein [Terriglobales bacterium]